MSEANIDETQRQLLPQPGWSSLNEPYWFAAGQGKLVVRTCNSCATHHWPPSTGCYHCHSQDMGWGEVPGTGTVFSFTWADWPPPPDDNDRNISVIELDGAEGPDPVRMISWVVDIEREQLECGMPVEVAFLEVDDEVSVPVWKPRT
jgi:uncharacterized OB-fold protein